MANTWRTLMAVTVVAAACAVGPRPVAAEGVRTIALHIDDHAQISATERATAEAEATRIYAAAGVRVIWMDGPVDPQLRPDDMTHLAIVILGAADGEQKPAVEDVDSTILGRAARAAGRAYIHYRRVAFTAHQRARDVGTVLGMVIAHEVGHLLLPPKSHSVIGIMRADLYLSSMLPQEFTPRQSARITATLSGDARTAQ